MNKTVNVPERDFKLASPYPHPISLSWNYDSFDAQFFFSSCIYKLNNLIQVSWETQKLRYGRKGSCTDCTASDFPWRDLEKLKF